MWCETANYKELVQLHTLVGRRRRGHKQVNLLTTEQRCCLFWVTQLLALQADAAALTRVFASKLGGSYNGECIASILRCLVKNCAFAFFPSIPRLTQAVAAQSAVGLLPDDQTLFSFPAFSMRARFADLHEQARAEQTATTDLASLMEFYACPETFSEPRISIHENAEWSAAWMRVVQAHRCVCLLQTEQKKHQLLFGFWCRQDASVSRIRTTPCSTFRFFSTRIHRFSEASFTMEPRVQTRSWNAPEAVESSSWLVMWGMKHNTEQRVKMASLHVIHYDRNYLRYFSPFRVNTASFRINLLFTPFHCADSHTFILFSCFSKKASSSLRNMRVLTLAIALSQNWFSRLSRSSMGRIVSSFSPFTTTTTSPRERNSFWMVLRSTSFM